MEAITVLFQELLKAENGTVDVLLAAEKLRLRQPRIRSIIQPVRSFLDMIPSLRSSR